MRVGKCFLYSKYMIKNIFNYIGFYAGVNQYVIESHLTFIEFKCTCWSISSFLLPSAVRYISKNQIYVIKKHLMVSVNIS